MDFFRQKRAGRKYVDIIHKAGGIWANWQPSISIQVSLVIPVEGIAILNTRLQAGHYGLIDKETGEFQRQGNIFHDPELAAIVSKYLPLTVCPAVDVYVLRSFDARNVDISPEAHVYVKQFLLRISIAELITSQERLRGSRTHIRRAVEIWTGKRRRPRSTQVTDYFASG